MKERIMEMLKSTNPEMVDLGKVLEEEEALKEKLGLHIVRAVMAVFPDVIVTGGVGMYLHGVRYKRWSNQYMSSENSWDIDLICPYFVNISSKVPHIEYLGRDDESKGFTTIFLYDGMRKIDFVVDPNQRWEEVQLEGFTYRVSLLEDIWRAKIEYGSHGNMKHIYDLYDVCGKTSRRDEQAAKEKEKYEEVKERQSRYHSS